MTRFGCLTPLVVITLVTITGNLLYAEWLLIFWVLGLGAWIAGSRWKAVREFRRDWHPQGKDLLLVYPNGTHWESYFEERWLPRWGARTVVLDASGRRTWNRENSGAEVKLFRGFTADWESNPVAILVPRRGEAVRVVRFGGAFHDFRHAEARLTALLERTPPLTPS